MKTDKKSWYQYPYVWLVISLPLSAVIAGIYTIYLAVISDDGLVTDDYYKEGMEINRVLERDEFAKKMDLSAALNLDQDAGKVKLMLTANPDFTYPEELKISFLNKTRKGFDKQLMLNRGRSNIYEAVLPDLIAGNWYVQIESEAWRLLETITISSSTSQ